MFLIKLPNKQQKHKIQGQRSWLSKDHYLPPKIQISLPHLATFYVLLHPHTSSSISLQTVTHTLSSPPFPTHRISYCTLSSYLPLYKDLYNKYRYSSSESKHLSQGIYKLVDDLEKCFIMLFECVEAVAVETFL